MDVELLCETGDLLQIIMTESPDAVNINENADANYVENTDENNTDPVERRRNRNANERNRNFNENIFECPRCGKTYTTKKRMMSHNRDCGQTYRCGICDKVYAQKRTLKHHLKNH